MIELSIIIVNYNTFSLTNACIASIYQHTIGVNFEIILVDNCSNDVDPATFKKLFPKIKLIQNPANVGFAKANNIGLANTEGRIVLLLNSDTELFDNSITKAYMMLRQARGFDVITGKLIYPDGTLQYQCSRFPSILLQLVELFRIQKLLVKVTREKLMLGGFFDHLRPVRPDWIWGTFFMFHKRILNSFPDQKFTETYFMYQEDLEWCHFIKIKGYHIAYDPSISIIHHFGSSNKSSGQRQAWLQENLRDFVKRYYGDFFTILYFALVKLNQNVNRILGSENKAKDSPTL